MPKKNVKSGKKAAEAINFNRMIASVLKEMNGAELDPAAAAALNSAMNGMVENITEEAVKRAGDGATLDSIKEAAKKILPENVVQQTVADLEQDASEQNGQEDQRQDEEAAMQQ